MFTRSTIYTTHENPDAADAADRLVLVPEGFCFWAAVLGPIWLLMHRMWLVLLGYVIVVAALPYLGSHLGMLKATLMILHLALQLLLGFYARDLQRGTLARRGYVETGVVSAVTEMEAQRRALTLVQ